MKAHVQRVYKQDSPQTKLRYIQLPRIYFEKEEQISLNQVSSIISGIWIWFELTMLRWLEWSTIDLKAGTGGVEVHARSLARELQTTRRGGKTSVSHHYSSGL